MAKLITTSVASLLSSACADYVPTLPDTSSPIGTHQIELSHSNEKWCVYAWLHIWKQRKRHSSRWPRPLFKNTSQTWMTLSGKVANSVFIVRTLTCSQQALVCRRCCWSTTPTHVEALKKSWYALQTPTYSTLSTVVWLFVQESWISVKLHRYRFQPALKAWKLFLMCPFPWMELWYVIRYILGHAWSIDLSTESDVLFCAVRDAGIEDSLSAIYCARSCVRRATLVCDCCDPTLTKRALYEALFHFAVNSVIPPLTG